MPAKSKLKCDDIRGLFNVALQLAVFTTTLVTVAGPDINYHVRLGVGENSISWEMTKFTFMIWTTIDYVLHLCLMCLDIKFFNDVFHRPLRRNVTLKAVVVNGLRLFVTLTELLMLSQNWTGDLINKYGFLGLNWMLRLLSLLLELSLCTILGLVVFHRRTSKVESSKL